jgi:hypothetical protein
MKQGDCALCQVFGYLHESHFLPKSVYKLMRDSNNGNDNPVLMSKSLSSQRSFQMTQPLLCSTCERRFSDGGESYVIPRLHQRKKFSLLDRLKLAQPLYVSPSTVAFVCSDVGLDAKKIGYFGLSILWRAAVCRWRMFDNDTTGVVIDPKYVESIRRYLMGETGFPADVAVVATVCTDFVSQHSCFVPHAIPDNPMYTVCALLTKGLFFRFIMEDNPPQAMRAISIGHGGLIFVADCSEKSFHPYENLMRTTVPTGSLVKEDLKRAS